MRVLMIARNTLYIVKGGDTVQVLQTAAQLRRYNVHVDIKLTAEKMDYQSYDLLHFFNISRPADILIHIQRSQKPFVISTIFIDYTEYDKYHRKGLAGNFFRYLSADGIEYSKTVTRWFLGKDRMMSLSYLWKGQRRSIIEILKKAKLLLPNSHSEFTRLSKRYNCHTNYIFVPNGIDPELFVRNDKIKKDPLLVICVARIEGIKNQLNLVHALRNTKYKLLIIGSAAPNQHSYYQECRKLATENISFLEHLPQEDLLQYYQSAKVHVLPSWFETTGLSSLEAAAMDCNIVITNKGDTVEYFADDAIYCDPSSPKDIYDAVKKASIINNNGMLRNKILTHYTWSQATFRTIEAYER